MGGNSPTGRIGRRRLHAKAQVAQYNDLGSGPHAAPRDVSHGRRSLAESGGVREAIGQIAARGDIYGDYVGWPAVAFPSNLYPVRMGVSLRVISSELAAHLSTRHTRNGAKIGIASAPTGRGG